MNRIRDPGIAQAYLSGPRTRALPCKQNRCLPDETTVNPEVVSTLIVARSEILAGPPLLANAISAGRGIRYSSMGGYLGAWDLEVCATAAGTKAPANNAK